MPLSSRDVCVHVGYSLALYPDTNEKVNTNITTLLTIMNFYFHFYDKKSKKERFS